MKFRLVKRQVAEEVSEVELPLPFYRAFGDSEWVRVSEEGDFIVVRSIRIYGTETNSSYYVTTDKIHEASKEEGIQRELILAESPYRQSSEAEWAEGISQAQDRLRELLDGTPQLLEWTLT